MRGGSRQGYPPARWRGGSSKAAKPLSEGWGAYTCSEFAIGAHNTCSEQAAPPDPSPPRAEFTLGLAEGKTRGRAGGGEQEARS
jgi:hypothetical protein